MKRINEQRPKAFIGAAISVGTQLIGGIIGNRKKKKAEQAERLRQERLQNLQNNQVLANAQNETIMSEEDKTQFLNQYLSKGGEMRVSPRKGAIKIVEGGTAIPIKKDSFLLKGRKHSTGGIVIDAGKTGVEAEGGEVVQVTPKQLKVFSAQPILNGESPAKLVQKGMKPSKVFNAQESFKDRNGLNDNGTKKKAIGGKDEIKQDNTSVVRPVIPKSIERKISPSGRVNVPVGTKYSDLSTKDKIRLRTSDNLNKDYKGLEIVSPETDILLAGQTGIIKAATKAGSKVGSNIVKTAIKETGKELASNAVSVAASEINPLLGLVPTLKKPRINNAPRNIESKRIAGLLESPEKMTRDQLKKVNAVAKRFGYKPIPLDYAKDEAKARKAVKDLVNQHNTFVRGVHPLTKEQYDSVSKKLKEQGLEVKRRQYL